MSKEILVSIIVNCYNGEEFLKETLGSVINQTYTYWELIFWDNQSNDKSAEILKSFNHPNFKYFYAPVHTDLGEARQLAFNKSKGDWIGFLDCDDIWLKDKLQNQISIIKSYKGKLGLIYSQCELFRYKLNNNKKYFRERAIKPCRNNLPNQNIHKVLFIGNFVPFPSVLYKREAVIKAGDFSKYKFSPDYFLNLYISLNYDVYAIEKVLCRYRYHQSNLSLYIKEIGILEDIEIVKFLSKNNSENQARAHKARYFIHLLVNRKFIDSYKYIKKQSLLNMFLGIIEILLYVISYKTKL